MSGSTISSSTQQHRPARRLQPAVNALEDRQLLSVAATEIVNSSSYNVTALMRWTPSSAWTRFTEAPGQGLIFSTPTSSTLVPQVQYCPSVSSSAATTVNLQGFGEWAGTGTPPAVAATVFTFRNNGGGVTLYFTGVPRGAPTVDHPGYATASAGYSPASGSLYSNGVPSYRDVVQGAVGDCWLDASLAEVAARQPSTIENMFTYDGNVVENGATVGLYTVRLYTPSGAADYVTVDTELPQGGGYYDHPNGNLWVALAEKAYAEANGAGCVMSSQVGSDSYGALNEGYPSWALQAITGKPASQFSVNPNNIAAAWNAGQFIVLTSDSTPASGTIVGSHAYAVVGYNPSSSTPYQVYNPWGTNNSGYVPNNTRYYGLFNASGGFLAQNFTGQTIQSGAEAPVDRSGEGTVLVAQGEEQAPVVSIRARSSASVTSFTRRNTPADEVVSMSRMNFTKALPGQISPSF